jgi:hypothetical protein
LEEKMRDSELYELEIYCREIVKQGKEYFKWDWDDRFNAVVASFSKKQKSKIYSILKKNFLTAWDHKNIKKAPENITAIAGALGGVREGQFLFMSDLEYEIIIFGAWWPWGGGDTISIRIGIIADNVSASQENELMKSFKSWFEI